MHLKQNAPFSNANPSYTRVALVPRGQLPLYVETGANMNSTGTGGGQTQAIFTDPAKSEFVVGEFGKNWKVCKIVDET